MLPKPIQLADLVTKSADDAITFRQECLEIKAKTEELANLLRQADHASINAFYDRPTRRIIYGTEQVLDETLILILRCKARGLKRVFNIHNYSQPRRLSRQLQDSIGDVSRLLRLPVPAHGPGNAFFIGLPPIIIKEPTLCLVWEQIAIINSGSVEERAEAVGLLVSIARENDWFGNLIRKEGGIPPLLKAAEEGSLEGQENAARAIGYLGRDPEIAKQMLEAGVSLVFAKILKESRMEVQVMVAWAISELAANYPDCQDHFAQSNIISLLVSHLTFETIQEHGEMSVRANREEEMQNQVHNVATDAVDLKSGPETGLSTEGRDFQDPIIKAQMKEMAAKALRYLCKGNVTICRSITESSALSCFVVLLEKSNDKIQHHSVRALMEITAVAEDNLELRQSAFSTTSPVVELLSNSSSESSGRRSDPPDSQHQVDWKPGEDFSGDRNTDHQAAG
ncbi:OLC1v1007308C1 [Oldenlandia corymbosa var. corymbosa]|uniref:OLC1v1007308C1 n=1 Tax=Oldenlandia corymbosa var. corymbosa TaxID=529605 RepID=A0AAV1DJ11_OLDCO|nr:OLC1v1007308C1 [Oldenlandia corymbosa var. corymbosa]